MVALAVISTGTIIAWRFTRTLHLDWPIAGSNLVAAGTALGCIAAWLTGHIELFPEWLTQVSVRGAIYFGAGYTSAAVALGALVPLGVFLFGNPNVGSYERGMRAERAVQIFSLIVGLCSLAIFITLLTFAFGQ